MHQPPKDSSASITRRSTIVIGVAIILAVAFWGGLHLVSESAHQSVPQDRAVVKATQPALPMSLVVTNAAKSVVASSVHPLLPNYPDFKMRPLPVAYDSPNFQWTLADGKDTNVIRELAHNPLEYARMVDENSRIFKRELVYLKETAAAVFERAKLTSQPVQQLTLPGVDGQELSFQISKSQGNGSSRQGMFAGHLVSNPDSMVTMAFEDGREAFTILDPKDNIYVVGEPREDGQVIVKAIDPNTYGLGPPEQGDDSIKTGPVNK